MEELKSEYARQGLVILAVNVDRSRERADAFLASMGSDLDVVYDAKGDLAKKFQVKDMPSSVLIDATARSALFTKASTGTNLRLRIQIAELLHEK